MRAVIIVASIVMLTACEDTEKFLKGDIAYECGDDSRELRAEFILGCLENANPRSDEEPEDWVLLCEQMANRAYCTQTLGFSSEKTRSETLPCSMAFTYHQRELCSGGAADDRGGRGQAP